MLQQTTSNANTAVDIPLFTKQIGIWARLMKQHRNINTKYYIKIKFSKKFPVGLFDMGTDMQYNPAQVLWQLRFKNDDTKYSIKNFSIRDNKKYLTISDVLHLHESPEKTCSRQQDSKQGKLTTLCLRIGHFVVFSPEEVSYCIGQDQIWSVVVRLWKLKFWEYNCHGGIQILALNECWCFHTSCQYSNDLQALLVSQVNITITIVATVTIKYINSIHFTLCATATLNMSDE